MQNPQAHETHRSPDNKTRGSASAWNDMLVRRAGLPDETSDPQARRPGHAFAAPTQNPQAHKPTRHMGLFDDN